MTDKCCSSSWSMGFCCSDSRGKNGEDEALPIPMPQTQMQKPPTEHMPLPEEDEIPMPSTAFTAATGEIVPLEPATAPQGMEISGCTSSIGSVYTVSFDSSLSQQIGLEFEILDPKNCLVSKVKDEGQVADWNNNAAQRERLKRYDCLRKVNGIGSHCSSKELVNMVSVCRGPVELTFERPTVLQLDVKRRGCKLGLAVAASKSDLGLLVRGIDREGAVLNLNQVNDIDYIIAGDRIVTVDGAFLPPGEIAKQLAGDEYQLALYRYLPQGQS